MQQAKCGHTHLGTKSLSSEHNIDTLRVRRGTVQDLAPETGGLRKPTPKPAPVAAAPPESAGAELAALPGAEGCRKQLHTAGSIASFTTPRWCSQRPSTDDAP
jgi:hypothetical protein